MRSVALTLALLFLFAAAAAAQTWYEQYDLAEAALAEERWSDAVGHLNEALAQQSNSGASVRTYGMRFVPYFPYLKLGIAYYHLGQLDAAQQAFETEERQGEVAQSADASRLIERYRGLIAQDRLAQQSQQRDRAADVLAESLAAARDHERQGQIEEALAAVTRALAVAPNDTEVQAIRQRLLDALAEREERQAEEARLARLISQGREQLGAGRYREAAASFREALALRPDDPDARSLLSDAQSRLRQEIAGRRDEAARQSLITASLDRAAELEADGAVSESLAELQAALALDPDNARARTMQRRLIELQAEAATATDRDRTIAPLLDQIDGLLAARDYAGALRTANRVLTLDPANQRALRQITDGYRGLNDALLADDDGPPAIVLDEVAGQEGGEPAAVRSPRLALTGTVYDSTPVAVRVLADGEPIGEITVRTREFQGVQITDFRWQHSITSGLTTVEVEAIDNLGNRASVPYSARYSVPFLRSWRFPAAVGAGLALLVLGLALARRQRKRKLLRQRFNPYIAGAPILAQKRFFGRRQLLDYVLRRISNNSIMLYGERRIGKTSFQHQLKRRLTALDDPVHEFFPVYIDLQGTPQEKFFATVTAEIFHELAPKLDGLRSRAPRGRDVYGYRDCVRDIQQVLKALEQRTGKKVKLVLLIDEVDELNEYDPRVNQKLRSLFMRAFAESLVAVVSGVEIKKHWEREGSPWYNFFQEIEVKPLDPDEAIALIEAPVRGIFAFEDGAASQIIERTAAKPYLIQRLCSALVDRMHEEGRQTITLADVEGACQVEGL